MDTSGLMQIGEVAERTGLSLRTIRYYEEVGLVVPTARSQGGFRLYTHADTERLQLIKRMKPLELTLEQTRELLTALDRLTTGRSLRKTERAKLLATLRSYHQTGQARCENLARTTHHRRNLPRQPRRTYRQSRDRSSGRRPRLTTRRNRWEWTGPAR